MATFKTIRDRDVEHCHVGGLPPCDELPLVSEEKAEEASEWIIQNFPNAIEVRRATYDYNCFGRALARSHGWFEVAETFLQDDHAPQQSLEAARVGDVVIYRLDGTIAHAAVVTRVENGQIMQLISKWGGMPEVLHTLDEVPDSYGIPVELHRRHPPDLDFNVAPHETEMGGVEMDENEFTATFREFTSRDVHFKLMLASTKEARERIIASLPAVQTLLERQPEAGPAVVEFFSKEETQNNPDASGIALFLLRQMPSEAAARAIAQHIDDERVSAVNRQLAAQAFLTSTHVEYGDEDDPVDVARRGAKAYLGRE